MFRFKIRLSLRYHEDQETQLNEIDDSFRTKFWIDEHQWFVRSGYLSKLYSSKKVRFSWTLSDDVLNQKLFLYIIFGPIMIV
jgi:hypothetical protein